MPPRADPRRPGRRGRGRAGEILVAACLCAATSAEARPRSPEIGLTLECVNIRRLSDNSLIDLRIRMQFDGAQTRYARFENTGRGWQMTGINDVAARTASRIVLADDPWSSAYIERLTGDYYVIDRTGTVLSVWGRCGRTHPLPRPF